VKRFPLLRTYEERKQGVPGDVAWSVVKDHEAQAFINHHQTLQRLKERSGLCVEELWCVVHDKKWKERVSYDEALAWLLTITGNTS
jgi:hypothetical protein